MRALSQPVDGAVELELELLDPADLPALRGPPQLLVLAAQLGELIGGVMLAATRAASSLGDVALEAEHVEDVLPGQRGDHVPAPRLELDHVLRAQHQQGLAHGG
nr:hypothetical protein GCM10020092_034830 [Actinoplanes digitatis]